MTIPLVWLGLLLAAVFALGGLTAACAAMRNGDDGERAGACLVVLLAMVAVMAIGVWLGGGA